MATYQPQTANVAGVTVKVDYVDVAGGFGGWFLLVVQGDGILEDSDFNPANGPSSHNAMAPGTGTAQYRTPFLAQVNARLDRLFGIGHSAKWTATIVESVTPAVIDDNW